MKFSVKFISRTAVLLALTVVFQMLGRIIPPPYNSFISGPLVNACLLLAAAFSGVWSGVIIAILAPFTSLINNHAAIAPMLLMFAPFIAIGNSILVVSFNLLKKRSKLFGVLAGAVLKFAFLWGAIVIFVRVNTAVNAKMAPVLVSMFSVPQLVTALIGGAVALAAMKALKNTIGGDVNG
ncbi:hypothetical protein DFR58_116103 [Anaerobacterium chartisolvens]|uniref:ECF transporter S component n=1 Tax=Anaerobacterium chartisolvens TaxID=1297424 RepID=A0A369B0A6_9FIRM|nr:ECF transporter S component [Anaerobacterium chartisolvens]RCX13867.1 hypothetical protein DFR58_116103 [Anaerobacterium chartisolvens]